MIDPYYHENIAVDSFQNAQNWQIIKRALKIKDWRLTVRKNREGTYSIAGTLNKFSQRVYYDSQEENRLLSQINELPEYISIHPFLKLLQAYPIFSGQRPLSIETMQFNQMRDAINYCQLFHSLWFEFATHYKCDSQSLGLDGKTLDTYNKQIVGRNEAIKKYLRSLLAKHPNGSICIELKLPKKCNLNSESELEKAIDAHQQVQTEFLKHLVKYLSLGSRDGYIWKIMPFLTQRNMLYSRIFIVLNITDEIVLARIDVVIDQHIQDLLGKLQRLFSFWKEKSQTTLMPEFNVKLIDNKGFLYREKFFDKKRYLSFLEERGWFNDAFVLNAPNKHKTIGFRQLK